MHKLCARSWAIVNSFACNFCTSRNNLCRKYLLRFMEFWLFYCPMKLNILTWCTQIAKKMNFVLQLLYHLISQILFHINRHLFRLHTKILWMKNTLYVKYFDTVKAQWNWILFLVWEVIDQEVSLVKLNDVKWDSLMADTMSDLRFLKNWDIDRAVMGSILGTAT